MNRYLLIFFLFICACSFNPNSRFWTKDIDIKDKDNILITNLIVNKDIVEEEINQNLKINLNDKYNKYYSYNSLDNKFSQINYDGILKKESRFKFSKINDYNIFKPEPLFYKGGIIFFNSKGTILKFDYNSKLLWKKNIYNKKERKKGPILFFGIDKSNLIVADNLANFYSLNLVNGKLIWKKKNSSPFSSQIKTKFDKFYLIDHENVIRSISSNDGKVNWKLFTEKFLIKSKKRLSITIQNDTLFFINTLGDITAVNINNGDLLWQTPTQNTLGYGSTFKLINSDLVLDENSIYFSNNKNEFFSINTDNGLINWKQSINSTLSPVIIQNLIFSVSKKGYLKIIDKNNGKLIKSTFIFDNIKKKEIKKILPTGFLIGKKNVYMTTNNGKLFIIDLITGKTKKIIKFGNQPISKPFIIDNYLYLVKNNSIIKIK